MPKRIEVSLDLLDTELESPKMRQVSLGLVLLVSEFLLGSGNNICHRYTGDISLYIYCLVGRTTSCREVGKIDFTTEAASMPQTHRILQLRAESPYPQFASSRHYSPSSHRLWGSSWAKRHAGRDMVWFVGTSVRSQDVFDGGSVCILQNLTWS